MGEGRGDRRPEPYVPLPRDLPDPREAGRRVFDEIAELYDTARPGYPPEAVIELVARCELDPERIVLEIGCGTGQLTRSLATLGLSITCLEPGTELARLARENLSAFPNVEIVPAMFEDAAEEGGRFDAVISATAFHWIDPSVAFPKAARLLRPGGRLALVSNTHAAGGTQEAIAAEVQALHRRLAPEVGSWEFPSVADIEKAAVHGGDLAAVWSRVERTFREPPRVDEWFEAPFVGVYPWLATYDRREYVAVLSSHSSYALMDPGRRAELLGRIGELVDSRLQGRVTKQYVTILGVAERV